MLVTDTKCQAVPWFKLMHSVLRKGNYTLPDFFTESLADWLEKNGPTFFLIPIGVAFHRAPPKLPEQEPVRCCCWRWCCLSDDGVHRSVASGSNRQGNPRETVFMGPPHGCHGPPDGEANGLCPGDPSCGWNAVCSLGGERRLNTASWLTCMLTPLLNAWRS